MFHYSVPLTSIRNILESSLASSGRVKRGMHDVKFRPGVFEDINPEQSIDSVCVMEIGSRGRARRCYYSNLLSFKAYLQRLVTHFKQFLSRAERCLSLQVSDSSTDSAIPYQIFMNSMTTQVGMIKEIEWVVSGRPLAVVRQRIFACLVLKISLSAT